MPSSGALGQIDALIGIKNNVAIAAILMTLLLIVLFCHTALGLRMIVEDYVHSSVKFAALISVRLTCFGLALAGILATLRIASGL